MRVFISIEVPDEVKNELIKLQKELSSLVKGRFVKEPHLTLKFLGEISEEKVEEIKKELKKVQFEPFDSSLNDLGVFPSQKYVRILWVGINPAKNVMALQQEIESFLSSLGFSKDKKFHPHITLARVNFVVNKEKLKEKLNKKINKLNFKVNNFRLMKSTLTPEGPIYEVLETYTKH